MKKIALITIPVLALVLVAGGYLYYSRDNNSVQPITDTLEVNKIDYSPSTEEDAQYVDTLKQQITADEANSGIASETSFNLTGTQLNGESLSVRTLIGTSASGTCVVTISDGSISEESQSDILNANGTSGCVTNVDVAKLNANLDWSVSARAMLSNGEVLNLQSNLSKDGR